MSDSKKNLKFADKIQKLELELEEISTNSIKNFPNQLEKQKSILLEAIDQKVAKLLKEMPKENRESFNLFVKEKLNLKSRDDSEKFLSKVPMEVDYLVKSHLFSQNS